MERSISWGALANLLSSALQRSGGPREAQGNEKIGSEYETLPSGGIVFCRFWPFWKPGENWIVVSSKGTSSQCA